MNMKIKKEYGLLESFLKELEINSKNLEIIRETMIDNFANDYKKTKENIDFLMNISLRKNYRDGVGVAQNLLGYYYEDLEKNIEAREAHLKSWNIFRELKDKRGEARACNGLMTSATSLGNYQDAIEWGEKGIELCKEIHDYDTNRILGGNIAEAYFKIRDFQGSYEILLSLEKNLIGINIENQLIIKLNKAHAVIELGNLEEAKVLLEDCYKILDESTMWILTEIQYVHAKFHLRQNQIETALDMIMQSYDAMNKYKYTILDVDIRILWGEILTSLKKYEDANQKFEEAEKITTEKKLNDKLELLYHLKYKLMKSQGMFEEALYYAKIALDIRHENRERICKDSLGRVKVRQAEISADIYSEINKSLEDVITLGIAIVNDLSLEEMLKSISIKIKDLSNVEEIQLHLNSDDENIKYYIDETGIIESGSDYKYYINEPIEFQNKSVGTLKLLSNHQDVFGTAGVYKARMIAAYISVALENIQLMKNAIGASETDYLTGILNRKTIMEKLSIASKNQAKESSVCIIMVDIDNFKKINDNFGHDNGDIVIKTVAKEILKVVRDVDFCGRVGGEEFLIVLPKINIKSGIVVAERIRKAISEIRVNTLNGEEIQFTASFGVTCINNQDSNINNTIEKADKLLYKAKVQGRNRVCS